MAYWQSSIVCDVLGDNPPIKVMEGFVHRISKNIGIDKIVVLGRGIFLIRFNCQDSMLKVINWTHCFFDNKPFIMKPWYADMEVLEDDLKSFHIWVKVPQMDIKYWGENTLIKISGLIEKMVKLDQFDQATRNKEKLMFASVCGDQGGSGAAREHIFCE